MASRITGMYSGLDTESLISDLVKSKSAGVTKLNKNKTKTEWKQEAWSDLNKKIKSLHNGTLASLRFSSSYAKKKTTVSNTNAVSVITGDNAMNSVQTLNIKSLAKSGYLTGQEIKLADGSDAKETTKLSELTALDSEGNTLEGLSDLSQGGSFTITVGGKSTKIEFDADTTLKQIASKLSNAGVSANFDEKNNRLFIGANGSGKSSDFTITADNEAGFSALTTLGINVSNDASSEKYSELAKYQGTSLDDILADTGSKLYSMLKDEMGSDEDYDAAYAKLMEKIDFAAGVSGKSSDYYSKGAVKLDGENAVIELNGARFESNTNTFEINGLTLVANAVADDITVTTQNDTTGIYDTIKKFLSEYNSVINDIDKAYNASSTTLEPLTDEEKDAVSDSEAEKIEGKVKDAILRKDETLGSVFSALKSVMSSGIQVNGKTMYLSDFGINTPNYLETEEGKRNAYHIDGDSDDDVTSGNADKLLTMISTDPDTVVSFFTELSKKVYDKMTELSANSSDSSFGSFYNDKQIKTEISDITSKITKEEEKIQDFEDKYYDKFSKMETALAKMQDKTSYISSLFS